jgi:ABC-type glycerol-3-phosphate transport system permease component
MNQSLDLHRESSLTRLDSMQANQARKMIDQSMRELRNQILNFQRADLVNEEFIRRSLNKFITNFKKAGQAVEDKIPGLKGFVLIFNQALKKVEDVKLNLVDYEKKLLGIDYTGRDIDFNALKTNLLSFKNYLTAYSADTAGLDNQYNLALKDIKALQEAPSFTVTYLICIILMIFSIVAYFYTDYILKERLVDEEECINLKKAAKFLLPKLVFFAIIMPCLYLIGKDEFSRLMVNYSQAWYKNNFDRYFFNSFYIAVTTTFFQILTSALAAYAFSFMDFKGKNTIFMLFLATMMIPGQAILVPNYLILAKLRWVDTYWALIFPFCAQVFGIFLLRQFFMAVPKELYDAAKIDGCSRFGFFWRVLIPLSIPAVTTMGIFTFIGSWNSFLWALIVTHRDSLRTIQVGLSTFKDAEGTKFELLMAASTFCILPLIIGFFLAQKQFIEGISRSGMKG